MIMQYTFTTSKLHTTYPLPAPRRAMRAAAAPCGLSRQELREIVAQMVG
ncbi:MULTISPECIES: hypothetical protein [unclassified Novosphingobium]|nr:MULTISPECIES: hypothetical protein [unclassified Novosphingobium]NKJ40842.1 hypothetical protein [Novosphingobium sp. SG720]NMN03086.1 hypothetical protein [Novosphingobium sp. SG919]NMN86926.1 hypothetical protein [Novosphingobium sp. SG916]